MSRYPAYGDFSMLEAYCAGGRMVIPGVTGAITALSVHLSFFCCMGLSISWGCSNSREASRSCGIISFSTVISFDSGSCAFVVNAMHAMAAYMVACLNIFIYVKRFYFRRSSIILNMSGSLPG